MPDSTEFFSSHILIVDDSPLNIEIIRDSLDDQPYRISEAQNGEEALKFLETGRPDLILLDAMMPGPDGFEVTRQIRTNPQTRLIPIVMITALDGHEDRLRGLESGVDDFISKPFNIFELKARIRNLLKLREYVSELEHAEQVIFSLARAVEAKDKYTEGHCERLSDWAVRLGRKLNLSEADLLILRRGGILHDVGKIAIHDSILNKNGKLTTEEFEIIKKHPEIGERICAPLKTLKPVLPTIRYHQERFNGSGYPDGLKGFEIPIHARIISIADCFDALTTHRPYRAALDKDAAIEIMEEETRRGLWDPEIFNIFKTVIDEEF